MRIDVRFTDRVGIAHEILAVLARRRLNAVAVEVVPPHVFIDAPDLVEAALTDLRRELLTVQDVRTVEPIDMLPGERRRLHLDALLDAMAAKMCPVCGSTYGPEIAFCAPDGARLPAAGEAASVMTRAYHLMELADATSVHPFAPWPKVGTNSRSIGTGPGIRAWSASVTLFSPLAPHCRRYTRRS